MIPTLINHRNIIKYCNRPFDNVEDMNSTLIKNWNSVVDNEDTVYHLGDFGMGNKYDITEWRSALNGRIKLIKGNHDGHSNQWYRDCGFDEVYDHSILIQDFYILSHAPLSVMPNYPFVNIFGHIHNNGELPDFGKNFYNACVEVNNYTPILFEEIKKSIEGD